MSAREEDYMSAEELRNRLYHSLRDKGLVNSMKSQLRTNLVSELKQSVKGKLSIEELSVPESGSLIHRASNSLVADHLRSCRYDYTHSVFLPECCLDKTKMLTNEDILQLLKISPESRLFKKMTVGHPEKSRKGFLWQLLTELCSLHSQSSQTTSTQTDLIRVATVSTLDEKMSVLDDLFSSRREEQYRTGSTALEDRLLKFQKHLEERFKSEFKLEVSRVKEEEITKIRREEKENFRRELDKARKDLERSYQSKFEGLVVRERNATERIQREQEMQEKEIYNQRQSILQEIEAVRQREVSVKRESEVINREKKLDQERVKAKDEDLRRREQEVKQKEREFASRLENELTKFKVEYQAKFLDRTQNIEVREACLRDPRRQTSLKQDMDSQGPRDVIYQPERPQLNHPNQYYMQTRTNQLAGNQNGYYLQSNVQERSSANSNRQNGAYYRENEKRVAEDQGLIDGLKGDLRDKTARVNELETLLQETRHKEVGATKHNDFLNAKLRDMADYAALKDQNISYRTELDNLKMRMAEIMQLNERERIRQEEMMRELRRPTAMPEYIERDSGRQERAVYEHQRVAGGHRYHEQVDRNDRLIHQFEAQTLQMKEMNQELVDVKQTLAYTQKALSNEVYRKPQDADTSRMVSFTGSHRSKGRDIHLTDNDSDLDLSIGGQRKGQSKKSSRTRVDRDDVYNDVDLDDLSAPKISTDFTTTDGEESSNQSADIIAETKYRLKSLEKEATNLERAYVDFHYQLSNPSSLPDPTRHSFRKSQGKESVSKGHRGPSPNASPIASRPMSSTPYQKPYGGSTAEADLSTDSLHELKGSGSYHRKKASGQDPVPKFSLSDMSEDEDHLKEGERVERPRPITVDDLEARPGSPSIMVVQADPSNDEVPSLKDTGTGPTKKPEEPHTVVSKPLPEIKAPAKLPPLSLDSAWQTPSLDTAWKTEESKHQDEEEDRLWEEKQRQKEEERRRQEQEAFEREQRELEKLQQQDTHLTPQEEEEPEPVEEKKVEEDIDPVMKQYMEMIQQKRAEPQRQESEKTASQVDNDLSLTESIKSNNAESDDDFNW